jgi:hypothetical protein
MILKELQGLSFREMTNVVEKTLKSLFNNVGHFPGWEAVGN